MTWNLKIRYIKSPGVRAVKNWELYNKEQNVWNLSAFRGYILAKYNICSTIIRTYQGWESWRDLIPYIIFKDSYKCIWIVPCLVKRMLVNDSASISEKINLSSQNLSEQNHFWTFKESFRVCFINSHLLSGPNFCRFRVSLTHQYYLWAKHIPASLL